MQFTLCAQLSKLVWKIYSVCWVPVFRSVNAVCSMLCFNLYTDMLYLNFVHSFFYLEIMKFFNLFKHGWIEVDALIFTLCLSRSSMMVIIIINCFQPEPLSEVFTIASLQHATNSIGACADSEFRLRFVVVITIHHGATVFSLFSMLQK